MFITVEDVFSSCKVHCILYNIYKVQCDMFIISYMMVVFFVLHCLILMTCLKNCADDWLEKLKVCAMMAIFKIYIKIFTREVMSGHRVKSKAGHSVHLGSFLMS